MTSRIKILLIGLFLSVIILVLSIIFKPFEPEEETTPPGDTPQEEELPL